MRGTARRRLRSVAMPDDRAHEVVVGRDASPTSTPDRPKAASSSASRARAAAANRSRNPRSPVSTSSCSPVSASWTRTTPTSGSSRSRGSTSRTASSSWRWSRRWRWRSQPGVADEVGHDHDERPAADRPRCPPRAAPARSVAGARGAHRLVAAARRSRRRTAVRPDATGIVRRLSPLSTIAPIRLPRRVRTRASVVDEVDEHRPLEPVVADRPEVHRRAEVEQEPGRDLAVLVVLADVGRRSCAR